MNVLVILVPCSLILGLGALAGFLWTIRRGQYDDIVDTAGTLTRAAQALRDEGALDIMAACTHGLLSGPAYDRIEASPLERLIITDTIPLKRPSESIEVVSVSSLFSKAIRHIYTDRSVSTLFRD